MDAGLKLKKVRERLGLRYRQVEHASNLIAQRRRNSDFVVGLSRLADIENKGVIPSIHRLYSLCAIYRLELADVLEWYGISVSEIWTDAGFVSPPKTHPIEIRDGARGTVPLPLKLDPGLDLSKTTDLTRLIQQWGRVPLSLLDNLNLEEYRYAFIGAEDFMMYPLLRPGALVQIDESRRTIRNTGWSNEYERPIYFLELRERYVCSWCNLSGDQIILQPHSGSPCAPEVLHHPTGVDVVGQVVGVAMQIELTSPGTRMKGKARSAAGPG